LLSGWPPSSTGGTPQRRVTEGDIWNPNQQQEVETRSRKRQVAKRRSRSSPPLKAIPHRAIVSGLSRRLACEDDAVSELTGQTHRPESCRGLADWQPTIELASSGQLGLAGPSKIFRCLHV
jgi:hypothetical protein